MSGVAARLRVGQPGGHPLHILYDFLTDFYWRIFYIDVLTDLLLILTDVWLVWLPAWFVGQPGNHPLHIFGMFNDFL